MRRRKGGAIDRDHRTDIARRFKALYRGLGMDLPACAQFLQVSERTLHNWESGRHVIPFAAYKLLRLLNRMELPGPSWAGWCFHGDRLISPEGRTFIGSDSNWWSLLVRRSALFAQLYGENNQLRVAVAGRAAATAGTEPEARPAVRQSAPTSVAGRAAQPPGPNLLLGHFGTQHTQKGLSPEEKPAILIATEKIANRLASTNLGTSKDRSHG